MSSTTQSDRIEVLLTQVDEALKTKNVEQARQALGEASRLNPTSEKIKSQWVALQALQDGGGVIETLRDYISSGDAGSGRKALDALKQKRLSSEDTATAVELLFCYRAGPDLLDILTANLISGHVESRKVIATKLAASATETFDIAVERGIETFDAFTSIPLDDAVWSSSTVQATAQEDMLNLCVATLMKAGAEHLSVVMKSIARLLTLAPSAVAPLVDADVFDTILSCLDIRLETPIRSQAMLATSKVLEVTKQRGEELLSRCINSRAEKQTNDDLVLAFSAAAAVFPVIPTAMAKLFLTDGFVQQLVPNLDRNWDHGAAGKRKSNSLEAAALELLSAACVDKSCREAIKRYCVHWLENLSKERNGPHQALASVVLAKISADTSEEITAKLETLVMRSDSDTDRAIEGLVYTSLQPRVKEQIAKNNTVLRRLVKVLTDRPAATFGCLTIFSNLTTYRPALTEEQKKMTQLKAYANSSKPAQEDPLDDDSHVDERCRKLCDADVVPALASCCKRSTSKTNTALVVKILLALAKEQKQRAKMAQQGAVKLLLQIKQRSASLEKSTLERSLLEREAAHALARLLISINPSHIFTSGLPASSAVNAIIPLLSQDQNAETSNLLPTFEGLLALTNLASMEDNSIRDLEVRLAWSQLEDQLLLSSNILVQRASVELVCNLMASPSCVGKFVGDGSKREGARMQILLALADAEDLATRRAAGGALATLTEWDAAVTAVLDQSGESGPKGIKVLLALCTDGSDEIKHRGFVCLANVINAPGSVGQRALQKVKEAGGISVLQSALKKTKSRDVLAIGLEVLKQAM